MRGASWPNFHVHKAEVDDDRAVLPIPYALLDVNHDVIRLEVSMENVVAVKKADSFEQALEKVNPLHI